MRILYGPAVPLWAVSGNRIVLLCSILFCCCTRAFAQPSQVQVIIDSLTKKLSKETIDTVRADLLVDIGIQYYYLGNTKAEEYIQQSLEVSTKANWLKGIGNAYNMYANIYLQKGDLTAAIKYADSSYNAFARGNRKRGMGSALQKKGVAYDRIGFYTEALKYHLENARINEELKDTAGLVNAYINIGNGYYGNHDVPKALEMYHKALDIGKAAGLKREVIPILLNIGQVHAVAGEYEKAKAYYQQAEKALQETGDATLMGGLYITWADLFQKTKEYGKAYDLMTLALKTEQGLGNQYQIGRSHFGLGLVYLDVAKLNSVKNNLPPALRADRNTLLNKAKQELLKAVDIALELKDLNAAMDEYQYLSTIEAQLGNHPSALTYYKEHTRYKDSLFNDENKKKLSALEMQHLNEVKNREISLINKDRALTAAALQRKNLLIIFIFAGITVVALFAILLFRAHSKRRKARFSQQVTEMENQVLRLQMNPHFMFNSLHAINKYILDNEKEKASDYLARFSQLMRLTLENSRQQEVLLSEDLHALELYMQLESLRFPNGFRYAIAVSPEIDKENTLIPPMLLQPFVENSILHGIRERADGEINVRVFPEGNSLKCVVEDNGEGLPSGGIQEMKAPHDKHISMGVKITRERLQMIGRSKNLPTSFAIFSGWGDAGEEKSGVKVELSFPYEAAF